MRALAVLATADRWVKGHRKSDGRAFFAIPGGQCRVYYVGTRDCTCPDHQERQVTCKHILAVRMWTLANVPAQSARAPKPAPRCIYYGGPVPAGVIVGTCNDCYDVADILDGLAAIKAALSSDAGAIVQVIH